jgi:hypothetical protein
MHQQTGRHLWLQPPRLLLQHPSSDFLEISIRDDQAFVECPTSEVLTGQAAICLRNRCRFDRELHTPSAIPTSQRKSLNSARQLKGSPRATGSSVIFCCLSSFGDSLISLGIFRFFAFPESTLDHFLCQVSSPYGFAVDSL